MELHFGATLQAIAVSKWLSKRAIIMTAVSNLVWRAVFENNSLFRGRALSQQVTLHISDGIRRIVIL